MGGATAKGLVKAIPGTTKERWETLALRRINREN
jgi:hypothetical protein